MGSKTILILPDSFKGSLSAAEVGEAMATGATRACTERGQRLSVQMFPAADGGEGTADALCVALAGERCTLPTLDLFGHPMSGTYVVLPGDVPTAALDMATCAGLGIARQYGLDPLSATTYGVGLMIDGLISRGFRRILVGLGGSGTNDGGIGALAALGARFVDDHGQALDGRLGGQMLSRIRHIDTAAVHKRLAGIELVLLYDVALPLTGDTGATRMFAAQKGATSAQIEQLEMGMERYAGLVGRAVSMADGAGAAGGLGCGLHLAGGTLRHGASYVLDTLGIPALLQDTLLVLTGEGKTDVQTAKGKLPCTVARYAKAAGVPCIDICGQAEPVPELYEQGMTAVVPLVRHGITVDMAMTQTAALLTETVYAIVGEQLRRMSY